MSHRLLFGVLVQKSSQLYGDITDEATPQTGPAHTPADGVQGVRVDRRLRDSRGQRFQLTGAVELLSTGQRGGLTPGLQQQQIYCQAGDAV